MFKKVIYIIISEIFIAGNLAYCSEPPTGPIMPPLAGYCQKYSWQKSGNGYIEITGNQPQAKVEKTEDGNKIVFQCEGYRLKLTNNPSDITATLYEDDRLVYEVDISGIKSGDYKGQPAPVGDFSLPSDLSSTFPLVKSATGFKSLEKMVYQDFWFTIIKEYFHKWLQEKQGVSFKETYTLYSPDGNKNVITLNVEQQRPVKYNSQIFDKDGNSLMVTDWNAQYEEDKLIGETLTLKAESLGVSTAVTATYTYDKDNNLIAGNMRTTAEGVKGVTKFYKDGGDWIEVSQQIDAGGKLSYFSWVRYYRENPQDQEYAYSKWTFIPYNYPGSGLSTWNLEYADSQGNDNLFQVLKRPEESEIGSKTPQAVVNLLIQESIPLMCKEVVSANSYVIYDPTYEESGSYKGLLVEMDEKGNFSGYKIVSASAGPYFALRDVRIGHKWEEKGTGMGKEEFGRIRIVGATSDMQRASGKMPSVVGLMPRVVKGKITFAFNTTTGEITPQIRPEEVSIDEGAVDSANVADLKKSLDNGRPHLLNSILYYSDKQYTEAEKILNTIMYVYSKYSWPGDTVVEQSKARGQWLQNILEKYASDLKKLPVVKSGYWYFPSDRPVTALERDIKIASYVVTGIATAVTLGTALSLAPGLLVGGEVASNLAGAAAGAASLSISKLFVSSSLLAMWFGAIDTISSLTDPEKRNLREALDTFCNGAMQGFFAGIIGGITGALLVKTGVPLFVKMAVDPRFSRLLPAEWMYSKLPKLVDRLLEYKVVDQIALLAPLTAAYMGLEIGGGLVLGSLNLEEPYKTIASYILNVFALGVSLGVFFPGSALNLQGNLEKTNVSRISKEDLSGKTYRGYEALEGIDVTFKSSDGKVYTLQIINYQQYYRCKLYPSEDTTKALIDMTFLHSGMWNMVKPVEGFLGGKL